VVRGLDVFRLHFEPYADRFVLIGGVAGEIALHQAGLTFRATKDLDIVLCVETLDVEFTRAFWAFVRAGRYENRQKSTGRRLFYLALMEEEESIDLRQLGLRGTTLPAVLADLKMIYGLER
jgi:hypothetical protein